MTRVDGTVVNPQKFMRARLEAKKASFTIAGAKPAKARKDDRLAQPFISKAR